ncbi:hypothetical protein A3I99_03505 [Candidatus Kaiserbacteria bacterium RIFCSPLOWO2_02_FULL_45_11b]|uniref:Uncharacterized protein n=1 Tax=Candidatus Kaiserbacteria bacterium RIFCSPLOWO2_12_FULL_45_26 TaxID=1798525 RepID=A0A1F6FH20_9BACT|nr:MAG: hypothetical protein A2Z56_03225 [Candidatus Kaiserbacteria bacterium RIFCSPHIGHO2_12_45_16]OGG69992.1 MAG: hypothetical protein A2929_02380 [Candidatus Kaiserbacteria bacterium RIFCSPLOWO2_01_FULL_45_25]OGG83661.1 MAG: hypothetical protein A3I99_03505 [Candidatus Kaiserbacteria bacterium RIFCSPLOWO2_02_FULL_45_11b]OGG85152.1 MAG: hypothetical protein A3G90_03790 [Candidatus Kaiserbacteria bacterium RIFCSPLOWO2_12_FULL_45_26]
MKNISTQNKNVPKMRPAVDLDVTTINTESTSFDFLKDEADIYTTTDVTKKYSQTTYSDES